MVPKGWEIKRIEQIADVKGGKRIPKGYSLQLEDNGFPYIRVKDMSENGVDTSSILYVPTEIVESISKYTISANDVFITVAGALLGLVGKIPPTLENANLTENADKLTNLKINQDYLIAVLRSPIGKKLIEAEKTTNAQPKLALTRIRNFEIPVPPLPEQQKIAKIISTWDKAISTTERLIDNSTQQKKALMEQLLTGKKRLLDDEGKRFEGEWEEVSVGSLGKIYSGGTPSTSNTEYWDGDINWITPTDITKQDSRYINSSLRKITLEGLENSSAKLVPAGSLLICTRATIGAMAVTSHEMCTNQGFKNIVPNSKTNIEFVYYLLTYNKHKMINKASGSTFLELSKSSFESMKFKVPKLKEQQKIATVLTNADQEIELLEQQLADFQQEKKALMQQLLTGKKRVVIDG